MSIPRILEQNLIAEYLTKELIKKIGWPNADDIVGDMSLLYSEDHERTMPGETPAHFGFVKGSGAIRKAVLNTGNAVMGLKLMENSEPLSEEDLDVKDLSSLITVAYRRLNDDIVTRKIWFIVRRAVSEFTNHDDPDDVRPNDPLEIMPDTPAYSEFLGALIILLREKIPKLPTPVINPDVNQRIAGASNLLGICEILLKEVVAPALVKFRKQF